MDELLHLRPDDLARAFAIARQESKFFPRPAEINEFIKRDRAKLNLRPLGAPGPNDRREGA